MDIALNCILDASGLSYVAQQYFKLLEAQQVAVVPTWIMPPDRNAKEILGPIAEKMLLAASLKFSAPPLQLHCGMPDVRLLRSRAGAIASVVLEGNRLLPRSLLALKPVNAILVPSTFCKTTCLSSGFPKKKTFEVSYPLASDVWNMAVEPSLPRSGRFRFLWMNTWRERKGWDVMLRSYWQEFSDADNVELVLKSYVEDDRGESLQRVVSKAATRMGASRAKMAPVTCIDETMPADRIPGFMKSFDAYVSPHRSEGFGLNVWHAMALGVPVIATDYGGTTDFVKRDTAWPVKVEKMSRPSDLEKSLFSPYLSGITWAEPDGDDLRRQMRICFSNGKEARKRAVAGAQLVASKYDAKKILSGLSLAIETVLPGTWDKLRADAALAAAVKNTEKFESEDRPLTLLEI